MTFNQNQIKVGDTVTRMLSGTIPMPLKVTVIDDEFIHCGPWKFNKTFGYEVDEELGLGVPDADGKIITGSYLVPPETP